MADMITDHQAHLWALEDWLVDFPILHARLVRLKDTTGETIIGGAAFGWRTPADLMVGLGPTNLQRVVREAMIHPCRHEEWSGVLRVTIRRSGSFGYPFVVMTETGHRGKADLVLTGKSHQEMVAHAYQVAVADPGVVTRWRRLRRLGFKDLAYQMAHIPTGEDPKWRESEEGLLLDAAAKAF
jgi:hypothetical protein